MTATDSTSARHLVTSHGADFFGQDRHAAPVLASLARYAEAVLPATDREYLVDLLRAVGTAPADTAHTVPADQVGQVAALLRKLARNRFVRSRVHAAAAALLADAADRAAADSEAWEWHIEQNSTSVSGL